VRDNILSFFHFSPSGEGESAERLRVFPSRRKVNFSCEWQRLTQLPRGNVRVQSKSHDCAIQCCKLSLQLHLSLSFAPLMQLESLSDFLFLIAFCLSFARMEPSLPVWAFTHTERYIKSPSSCSSSCDSRMLSENRDTRCVSFTMYGGTVRHICPVSGWWKKDMKIKNPEWRNL